MNRRTRTTRGFTLIELVLVMLIVGLLLAVVAPSMGALYRARQIDDDARLITALLKEASARAASDAKPYRLVIETKDNTCWLEVLNESGFERPKASYGRILELGDEHLIEMDGGEVDGSRLTVRVEPDGVGQLAQITLLRKDGERALAVYCRTPTEPYRVGPPLSVIELESGVDDVQAAY